ncbi:MAG: fructose-1,6-bisphosphate aldolase/phosphatase [Candidatus Aminicenantia bacterium]
MKIAISAIKADVGSVGGHITPGMELYKAVKEFVAERGKDLIIDYYISFTGDDVSILLTHTKGVGNPEIHKLGWDAFKVGTDVAKKLGLYGAGQDLLVNAFSGNVKGLGPAVAEMEFEERPSEPFIFFTADKTDPGAYNLPFYLAFADPMYCSGLLLSPQMTKGFKFTIIDVCHTERDRVIELNTPEDIYYMAALLRDPERFVIESIHSRATGEQAVAISTTRLHNIAGRYTGKDDPIAIVRVQGAFPATGEVLAPFEIGPFVAGFMRGSHNGPLMPSKLQTTISFFDGPPVVTGAAFSVKDGKLTGPVDVFDHPFWDYVREKIAEKAVLIRRQGFVGPSMLPFSELEYGGIVEILEELDKRFYLR